MVTRWSVTVYAQTGGMGQETQGLHNEHVHLALHLQNVIIMVSIASRIFP